ncbi:MAG: hypothetical protein MI892_02710 [Desulfobacterales bacterium]|nr:hypothetical protein [Desulfobacterales bacterium]
MKITDLNTALTTWYNQARVAETGHLDLEAIYRLSLDGELAKASHKEAAHLCNCPQCLDKWELLCFIASEAEDESDDLIGYGRLKAAAEKEMALEPIYLKSDCGRFELGLFPDPNHPGYGMATLDVLKKESGLDSLTATVKDAGGRVVLQAKITHGRTAAKIRNIDHLDLSIWTVTIR